MNVSDLGGNQTAIQQWLEEVYRDRLRPAKGCIPNPFVDPGKGYEDVLWEWDAYYCLVGLAQLAKQDPQIGLHARGCLETFLTYQGADGHVPYAIMAIQDRRPDPKAVRGPEEYRNTSKPLLAQFAKRIHTYGGYDDADLKRVLPALARHVDHWYETQMSRFGLLTWRSHRGSGADNHPAYYQRPHSTVADPYLNSMMVVELRTLAWIADRVGEDASGFRERAEALSAAIERWLWDPIDGTYYCIDTAQGDPGPVRTPADWAVPLKFRSWTMFMPLWAKVASPERAAEVVAKHLLPADQLRSAFGFRSLARCEPATRIFANYNPSDWCGPVWVVSTYLGFRALMNYGFTDEATALAADHLACLAQDYQANGLLHEYYHPEEGQGMTHGGFVNWNSCASLFQFELAEGFDTTEVMP